MAHTPRFVQVEVDAVNAGVHSALYRELLAEQAKLDRVQALITTAEDRIRSMVPSPAAEVMIEDGVAVVVSLKHLREAMEDEK